MQDYFRDVDSNREYFRLKQNTSTKAYLSQYFSSGVDAPFSQCAVVDF